MRTIAGKKKFNPDECRWEAEFGTGECVVRGNAVFPYFGRQNGFAAENAVILHPNSHLGEEWQIGVCRLASAAPEMLRILEKIAGLLDFCELEKLVDENLEKEIRDAIKDAKGEKNHDQRKHRL